MNRVGLSATADTVPSMTAVSRVCPLDGGDIAHDMIDEFYVCSTCSELLIEDEMVTACTASTRRRYIEDNGYQLHPDYSRLEGQTRSERIAQKIRQSAAAVRRM